MITYGFSIQGKSHKEIAKVCQDYNKHGLLDYVWNIGIVADGVGSASCSDEGSKLATESLYEYCKNNIQSDMSDEQLEEMLRQAYVYAFDSIVSHANSTEVPIEDYDTTLSSVIYNGSKVIFGHAGDGGILVRLCDGRIKPITKRQKGADGSSVIPLRGGQSSWEFGICDENVAAVLLATDGMLDGIFQPVLVNLPNDLTEMARGTFAQNNVYVTASEFFMNPDCVYLNNRINNADSVMKRYMEGELEADSQELFVNCITNAYNKMFPNAMVNRLIEGISKYYYAVWALNKVTDDKSVVCLMNEKASVNPQSIEYYDEPDWKWKQDCYSALLYGKPMPPKPVKINNNQNQSQNQIQRQNINQGQKFNQGQNFNERQNFNQGQNFNERQNFNQGQSFNQGQNFNQGQSFNQGQKFNQGQSFNQGQKFNQGQSFNQGQKFNQRQNFNQGQNQNRGQNVKQVQNYGGNNRNKNRGLFIAMIIIMISVLAGAGAGIGVYSFISNNKNSSEKVKPRSGSIKENESDKETSGSNLNSEPSSKPSSKPYSEPSSKPSSKPDSKPGSEPDSRPSSEPSSKPSSKPDSKPGSEPSSTPRSASGSLHNTKPKYRDYDEDEDESEADKSDKYKNKDSQEHATIESTGSEYQ